MTSRDDDKRRRQAARDRLERIKLRPNGDGATPHRRNGEQPNAPRRRREDTLEDLVDLLVDASIELDDQRLATTRRFRNYRRRAGAAFALLILGAVIQGYLIVDYGNRARLDLALEHVKVSALDCYRDNETRNGIRRYVTAVNPRLKDSVRAAFPLRSCRAELAGLVNDVPAEHRPEIRRRIEQIRLRIEASARIRQDEAEQRARQDRRQRR